MCYIRFFLLLLSVVLPSAVFAAPGGCRENFINSSDCQFEVLSHNAAPAPAISKGIRLDSGVQYVLFNNYPAIGPRFVSSARENDLFVPQNTEAEFWAFINTPVHDIGKLYAVPKRSYTATPILCAGMTPGSIIVPVPTADKSIDPVAVQGYTPLVDADTPETTRKIITSLAGGNPITFSLTRNDCSTDINGTQCVLAKFLEMQTLVFTATGTKPGLKETPNFKWAEPSVTRYYYVSKNGAAYESVANCNSLAPSINGTCGSSHGQTLASAPTTNLCSAGNATAVLGIGPWSWTCAEVSGGTSTNCQASKSPPVNGSCGTAAGSWVSSAPTTNLCTTGTAGAVSGSWAWTCYGLSGGSNATCTANKPAVCVPTSCTTCDYTGTLVNKANETQCRVSGAAWSVTATDAGWCYNGRCRAYFFDDCSPSQNYVARCYKGNVKSNRTIGTYETRSCSSCTTSTSNDSCTVCRNIWGSGAAGQWDFNRNFD